MGIFTFFKFYKWCQIVQNIIYVSQANNQHVNKNCPRTVFVQLNIRSSSIHPFVEEAIMYLFLYSFFHFSMSRLCPLNTMKGFVPSTFEASLTVTRHFSCPVVFILTVFFPTISTVLISAGWYTLFMIFLHVT